MFDDYQWKLLKKSTTALPRYRCVSVVLSAALEVVHLGYQFFCRKVSHAPPAVGPLTSTDAMEGEAATTAITSPDVPAIGCMF